ncbi:MAG: SdpI family protein [Clostridiales bacterium]|nr:SdpI family protein [Clostridiales bacterium]
MWFWIFMFICDLLIPLLMLGFGWWFKDHAPKTINGVYGYRTTMSMKNMDTWKFAHNYCGKLWWKIGIGMLPVSVVAMLFVLGKSDDTVGCVGGIICMVQCVILVASIFPVERALKKNFDKDGKRREIFN